MQDLKFKCICFFLFSILFSNSFLIGQSALEVVPELFEEDFMNEDLTGSQVYFQMWSDINNNTSDTIILRWELEIVDCPIEWGFQMSDKYYDYLPGISTNPVEVDLLPNEEKVPMVMSIRPNQMVGCCKAKVILSDYTDPSVVFDTINYYIRINDDCMFTSTKNFVGSKEIKIYPNPTNGTSIISIDKNADRVIVINELGQEVLNETVRSNELDVSRLDAGIYFIENYWKGKLEGVSKLVIQ